MILIAVAPLRSAWADYKIEPGDILQFAVAGNPDLAATVTVNIDGEISIPLVGSISVAGLDIQQALASVKTILPSREYRRLMSDGRDLQIIISPEQISLYIHEYRPIFLSGDVVKPGVQVFHPRMTVRDAVAVAGGFQILAFRSNDLHLQGADLKLEYQTLCVTLVQDKASLARVQAELMDTKYVKPDIDPDIIIDDRLLDKINGNAEKQLEVENVAFKQESEAIRSEQASEVARARFLSEQQSKEDEAVMADDADFQRYRTLLGKGDVALPAISEARRALVSSSARKFETMAIIEASLREQQELGWRLRGLEQDRRLKLLRSEQDASASAAITTIKLNVIRDELRFQGSVISQYMSLFRSDPRITVFRAGEGGKGYRSASMDSELEPGDSVELQLLPKSQPQGF